MTKRPDKKTIEERAYVARMLRALLETHEAALSWWVGHLRVAGPHWRRMLPEPEKGISGRMLKYKRERLASLLAFYRARPKRMKRRTFCEMIAAEGKAGVFAYDSYSVHQFRTKEAVASALKAAERLAKRDPQFDEEANEWRDLILSDRAQGKYEVSNDAQLTSENLCRRRMTPASSADQNR